MQATTLLKSISIGREGQTTLSRSSSVASPTVVLRTISGAHHSRHASLDSAVDLQFRLYKYDSGKLNRVQIPEHAVSSAFSADKESAWEKLLSPRYSSLDKSVQLADLLEVPLEGVTTDANIPKTEQHAYTGAYFLQQHRAVDQFVAKPSRLGKAPSVQVEAHADSASTYSSATKGEPATTDYRVFLQQNGKDISAWHDVPLQNENGTFNFVCEIPKETSAKMEVATNELKNPIKQDIKKGKLRYYPYNIHWNYGMLPQTWEDPEHVSEACGGITGDNDPVDVVEIGSRQLNTGGVYCVKPVGAYAMIDDGELDWKIICIAADDPLAQKINDIEDVERELPGELERIMVWFRDYKIPDGKPANGYGYDSKALNSEFAKKVIDDTHGMYKNLKASPRNTALSLV